MSNRTKLLNSLILPHTAITNKTTSSTCVNFVSYYIDFGPHWFFRVGVPDHLITKAKLVILEAT